VPTVRVRGEHGVQLGDSPVPGSGGRFAVDRGILAVDLRREQKLVAIHDVVPVPDPHAPPVLLHRGEHLGVAHQGFHEVLEADQSFVTGGRSRSKYDRPSNLDAHLARASSGDVGRSRPARPSRA
jgi:hypothetical protein